MANNIAWEAWENNVVKAIKRFEKIVHNLKELLIYVRERNEEKIIDYQNKVINNEEKKVLN